jgi:hypothetical protein
MARSIGDIQDELKKAMPKEQREALKDDWRDYRYLIRGLTDLDAAAEAVLFGENKVMPDEITRLYAETICLSEQIPKEWNFDKDHPEIDQRMTELIHDKGNVSESETQRGVGYSENSEYAIILNRFKEDAAALKGEPDAPIRFWCNPYRALERLETAGLFNHSFPVTEYEPLHFMRFITDDEIDHYLTRGGNVSESKMRIFAYFLNDHTPQENEKFLKDEYGHGGGTWIDGCYEAEPGKGITLKRPGCDDINIRYNKVAKRISELVHSGRYMTRAALDRIPDYENIMLARQINNFYYNLDDYAAPFDKSLDFHYPKEAEWTAICDFLSDTKRIEDTLEVMQKIYVNTSEEDRYYDYRKDGFLNLAAYLEGEYTLFPGLDKLPAPEFAATQRSRSATAFIPQSEPTQQLSLFDLNTPELIAESPLPVLSSQEEQKAVIERNNKPAAEVNAIAGDVRPNNLLSENDAFLLDISNDDKDRISALFTKNPRSRDTVRLVREIYGDDTPIPLPQLIKRIAELNESRKFDTENEQPVDPIYADYLKTKAENPGYVVLYQVDDFYEAFEDDAKLMVNTLDLTSTQWSTSLPEQTQMIGIPAHRLEKYIQQLRDKTGNGIAISSVGENGERSVTRLRPVAERFPDKTAEKEPAAIQESDLRYIVHALIYNGNEQEFETLVSNCVW